MKAEPHINILTELSQLVGSLKRSAKATDTTANSNNGIDFFNPDFAPSISIGLLKYAIDENKLNSENTKKRKIKA